MRSTRARGAVLRARTTPDNCAMLIDAARIAFPDATLLFNPARGSLRITTVSTDPVEHTDARIAAFVASAPPSMPFSVVMEQGASPVTPTGPLDQSVKRAFDPQGILNRRRPAARANGAV